jgi:hypothetical protein
LAQIKQDLKLAQKKINGYETHLKKELEITDIKNWKTALAKLKQKPNPEQTDNRVEENKLKEAQNKYLAEKDRREKVEKQLQKIKTILDNLQGKENIPPTEWQRKWNELLVVSGNNSSGKKPPQPMPHPPKSPPKPTDNNEKKGNNRTGLGEVSPINSAELNQAQQELEALKMEKLSLERQVGSLHKKLETLSAQNTLILVGGGFLIIILTYLLVSLPKKKSTKEG